MRGRCARRATSKRATRTAPGRHRGRRLRRPAVLCAADDGHRPVCDADARDLPLLGLDPRPARASTACAPFTPRRARCVTPSRLADALSPGSRAAACRDVQIQLMEKGAMAEEPRRLSDFLRAHRERILSDWVEAVRVLEPAKDIERPVLLDHLPQFLDQLSTFSTTSAPAIPRPTPPI